MSSGLILVGICLVSEHVWYPVIVSPSRALSVVLTLNNSSRLHVIFKAAGMTENKTEDRKIKEKPNERGGDEERGTYIGINNGFFNNSGIYLLGLGE